MTAIIWAAIIFLFLICILLYAQCIQLTNVLLKLKIRVTALEKIKQPTSRIRFPHTFMQNNNPPRGD